MIDRPCSTRRPLYRRSILHIADDDLCPQLLKRLGLIRAMREYSNRCTTSDERTDDRSTCFAICTCDQVLGIGYSVTHYAVRSPLIQLRAVSGS